MYSVIVGQSSSGISKIVGATILPTIVHKTRPHPIDQVIDRNIPKLEQAFLDMVDAVRKQLTNKGMVPFLLRQDVNGLLQYLDLEHRLEEAAKGAGLPPGKTSFQSLIAQVFNQGAQAGIQMLDHVSVQKASVGFAMAFDALSPTALSFLSGYTFSLIREMSKESRLAIGQVVQEAFREGGHPYSQARDIRNMIGLTRRQSRAVWNFRRMLDSGDPSQLREALTRALRDRRFDPSIWRAIRQEAGIRRDRVDTMVERYHQRYLQYRARTIARTETIRASNAGQLEAWQQARQQGLLDADRTRRKWIVTLPCPLCRQIRDMNKDGVPLDEPFMGPDGPIDYPPAHPNCRCTVGLSFVEAKPTRIQRPSRTAPATPATSAAPKAVPIPRYSRQESLVDDLIKHERTGRKLMLRVIHGNDIEGNAIEAVVERLKDNSAFIRYVKEVQGVSGRVSSDLVQETVRMLRNRWALSSHDENVVSIALQQLTKQEFGLTGAFVRKLTSPDVRQSVKRLLSKHKSALRAFLRANYEHTQKTLEQAGIKEIWLHRGMRSVPAKSLPKGATETSVITDISLQPMSSFSSNARIAISFAGPPTPSGSKELGLVVSTKVPRERILSTAATGIGDIAEHEFVVLGGKYQAAATNVRLLGEKRSSLGLARQLAKTLVRRK